MEPQLVRDRMNVLEERYAELRELAAERKRRLDDNKRLCQFWWDLADLENNFREQQQVLALTDMGRDIFSVNHLLAKHKNAENNLDSLGRALDQLESQGNALVDEEVPNTELIPSRLKETRDYYDKLRELAKNRRKTLEGGVEYYQFFTEADDVEAYLLDTLRVVSSDDVGRDEGSVQALLKKHDEVSDDLEKFERHIEQLQAQVQTLPKEVSFIDIG